MSSRDELVATVLRVIQRTADKQGNVTMLRLAENIANAVKVDTPRYTSADVTLEMSRRVEQAERRAEEAEYHVEQLRDALDSAERIGERAGDRECLICGTEVSG